MYHNIDSLGPLNFFDDLHATISAGLSATFHKYTKSPSLVKKNMSFSFFFFLSPKRSQNCRSNSVQMCASCRVHVRSVFV